VLASIIGRKGQDAPAPEVPYYVFSKKYPKNASGRGFFLGMSFITNSGLYSNLTQGRPYDSVEVQKKTSVPDREILIRIWILESVHWIPDLDPALFIGGFLDANKKIFFIKYLFF
jgi:hypothetical protein